jgi:hypothetical protein
MFPIPRNTKVNLWRPALYDALFMLAVRTLHTAVSSDSFVGGDMAELIFYFPPGILLFIGVGYINNHRLARQRASLSILQLGPLGRTIYAHFDDRTASSALLQSII